MHEWPASFAVLTIVMQARGGTVRVLWRFIKLAYHTYAEDTSGLKVHGANRTYGKGFKGFKVVRRKHKNHLLKSSD